MPARRCWTKKIGEVSFHREHRSKKGRSSWTRDDTGRCKKYKEVKKTMTVKDIEETLN